LVDLFELKWIEEFGKQITVAVCICWTHDRLNNRRMKKGTERDASKFVPWNFNNMITKSSNIWCVQHEARLGQSKMYEHWNVKKN